MVKIISISVSDEHKKILDDMELSPSGLFKQRMEQLKQESSIYNQKIEQLLKAVQTYREEFEKANQKIDLYQKKYGILEE